METAGKQCQGADYRGAHHSAPPAAAARRWTTVKGPARGRVDPATLWRRAGGGVLPNRPWNGRRAQNRSFYSDPRKTALLRQFCACRLIIAQFRRIAAYGDEETRRAEPPTMSLIRISVSGTSSGSASSSSFICSVSSSESTGSSSSSELRKPADGSRCVSTDGSRVGPNAGRTVRARAETYHCVAGSSSPWSAPAVCTRRIRGGQ